MAAVFLSAHIQCRPAKTKSGTAIVECRLLPQSGVKNPDYQRFSILNGGAEYHVHHMNVKPRRGFQAAK